MSRNFDERLVKIERHVKPLKPETKDQKELDEALKSIDPAGSSLSIAELEAEIDRLKNLPDEAFIVDLEHPDRVLPAHFGAIFKKLTIEHLEYLKHCKLNPLRGEKT